LTVRVLLATVGERRYCTQLYAFMVAHAQELLIALASLSSLGLGALVVLQVH